MLLLQGLVLLPEGVDTVNHGLDELDLGVSQPVLVGHVVGAACGGCQGKSNSEEKNLRKMQSLAS